MTSSKLEWRDIEYAVMAWSKALNPRPVYGVPRGGCVPAAMLALRWGMPILDAPKRGCIIVDDIIDSGKTREKFSDFEFVALVGRTGDDDGFHKREGWIEFPWEANETGPEDAVVRLIEFCGGDVNSEGLSDTPKRVVKAFAEMTAGRNENPEEILSRTFPKDGYDQVVVLKDIRFFSTCEHHLLPFFGRAAVAYVPGERVVGLSKLARLVDCFARRLQIQERLTVQVADALESCLKPQGVAVVMKAQHLCMVARGASKEGAEMVTSVMRGNFRDHAESRAEVLNLLK